MLLMDISGAYDNVARLRLLYDVQLLRMQQLVPWIESFLSNRATRLSMTGVLSELFRTPTGIPQGLLISLILFLIYNTLRDPELPKDPGNGDRHAVQLGRRYLRVSGIRELCYKCQGPGGDAR